MVCFVNPVSVDRVVLAIFIRFDQDWRKRTHQPFRAGSLTLRTHKVLVVFEASSKVFVQG